jgi:hypothetical protein
MAPKILTSTEAAALVGCDRTSLKSYARQGLIEGARRTPGGHWRFTEDGIYRFIGELEKNAATPTNPGAIDSALIDVELGVQVVGD